MSGCRRLALLAFTFFIFQNTALAGDFIDTRITFAVSDDNLLVDAGESNPNSPTTSFIPGQRSNLFFDNYNKRDSGFESLSHIVLYKKMPGFITGLMTEAALVTRMDYDLKNRSFRLRDAGTYINLRYSFNNSKEINRSLQLTAFPLSSNRFQLGYSYRISWGGDRTFPRRTLQSAVPAAKLQYNYDFSKTAGMFLFGGAKTGLLQKFVTETQVEEETVYGFLGGGGLRIGRFQWEFGAGYFDKGTFANTAVKGQPVNFYGFSTQVSYTYGMPVGVSIDFRLYRNDPQMPARFFRMEKYEAGKLSFALSSEFSRVTNLLEDPDNFGGIRELNGMATDLNFRMKYGYFRMHIDAMFRDLGFILKDVPGFVPFQTFSDKQTTAPEFFAALGVDYHFPKAYLTLGLKAGIQFPASVRGNLPAEVTGSVPLGSLKGEQLVLIREEGDFVLLPVVDENGNKVEIYPVLSAKANFKWQMSQFLALIGEILFSVDQNSTRLEKDQVDGTVTYTRRFLSPIQFGFNLMMQARF